ncbi:MAG: hypothetical protein HYT93_04140 [Parcubacteria group bacterium]|nr:hypothetical protein [Parcubacteria group bacterium]
MPKKRRCCRHLLKKPGMKSRLEWYYHPRVVGVLVKQAARLLDASVLFEWAQKIDIRKLNLACPKYDILGQVFGNYHEAFSLAYSENRRRAAFLSRSHATRTAWLNEIEQRTNK